MQTSEQINEIATALVAVQAKLENVTPGASGQFGSYLTLGDVLNAVRPVLTENGIAVIQSPGLDVGNEGGKVVDRVTLTTRLVHTSGQWIQGTAARAQTAAEWITEKQEKTLSPVQLAGNVITYLRRYSLASMVGVAQADNDGAAPVQPGQVRSLGTVAATSGPGVVNAPSPLPLATQADIDQAAHHAVADAVAAQTATAGEVFDGAGDGDAALGAALRDLAQIGVTAVEVTDATQQGVEAVHALLRHKLQDTILSELSRLNAEFAEFEKALHGAVRQCPPWPG